MEDDRGNGDLNCGVLAQDVSEEKNFNNCLEIVLVYLCYFSEECGRF